MIANMEKGKVRRQSVTFRRGEELFQIKISLRNIKPPIWRRVLVNSNLTLHELHLVIQAAMGWENYHLYQFELGRTFFSPPSDEDKGFFDTEDADSTSTKVKDLIFTGSKAKLQYEYDFGDGWQHDVFIERVVSDFNSENIPVCIAGKRACPPEDCGGSWGYSNLLHILGNPKDEEYEEMKDWVGGSYDPDYFDKKEANARLRRLEEY